MASVRLEDLVSLGVLRPLEVTESEVLALVRTTEPELYSLILGCRGCEHAPTHVPSKHQEPDQHLPGTGSGDIDHMSRWLSGLSAEDDPFDFAHQQHRESGSKDGSSMSGEDAATVASPLQPLMFWDEPASIAALIFQRAECVLEAEVTRRSTVLIVERLLLNLGYPDMLRAVERLGGELGALRARGGEGYRRLAAAGRELLQDWRQAHVKLIDSQRPQSSEASTQRQKMERTNESADGDIRSTERNSDSTWHLQTEDEQRIGVVRSTGRPTIARYAVHRPRLAAAVHRLASCWRPEFQQAATETGIDFPEFVSSCVPGKHRQPYLGGDANGGLCASNAAFLLRPPVERESRPRPSQLSPPLLVALLGDALLPSVWTEDTGVNRGMLSALDTTWLLLRAASLGAESRLGTDAQATAEIFNERERLYQLSKVAVQPIVSQVKLMPAVNEANAVMSDGALSGILRPQLPDEDGCVQLYRANPASRYTAQALARPLGRGAWIHTTAECSGDLMGNGMAERLAPLARAGDRGKFPTTSSPDATTAAFPVRLPNAQTPSQRRGNRGPITTQLVPCHYRMRLHSKAVGAAKSAPPQKRRAFAAAVSQDLADLLGVDESRVRITEIEDDDDEDEYPPLE